MSAITTRPPNQDSDSPIDLIASIMGSNVGVGTPRYYSSSVDDVVTWREKVATKYCDQLEEPLIWDEGSAFEVSDEVGTSGDAMFHYVAAILDQRGPAALEQLFGLTEPPLREYHDVFVEADRRSFSGRFPQLLLGANAWLPFKENLIIEELNPEGKLERYGSASRLIDEITSVRAAVVSLKPSMAIMDDQDSTNLPMAEAWRTSEVILRLAKIASAKCLPLWTTG